MSSLYLVPNVCSVNIKFIIKKFLKITFIFMSLPNSRLHVLVCTGPVHSQLHLIFSNFYALSLTIDIGILQWI